MMTRDEILAMKPGREMDALIWLAIIGKRKDPVVELMICRHVDGDIQPYSGYPEGHISPPHYSTSLSDAWTIIEKLKELGYSVFRLSTGDIMGTTWQFHCADAWREISHERDKDYYANANTAPEAICKCALLAIIGQHNE